MTGAVERRGDHIVDDLLFQRRRIDEHAVQAAGLGNQRHDRAIFCSKRAIDDARDFGRAGERNTGDARIGDELATDDAITDHQLQHIFRQAGLAEEINRRLRDARCLLCGLGDDCVACSERCRELAGENRQREIPRADANEHAAPVHFEMIGLACW